MDRRNKKNQPRSALIQGGRGRGRGVVPPPGLPHQPSHLSVQPQPQPQVVPQWGRVKWNSYMVKLLVSAVSYIDEDMNFGPVRGSRMSKWRLVSAAMMERGLSASPQQCEDKFHDLNKKYKRVTEILGRGTACDVVEMPELLEQLNLPAKLEEEARKHLSSDNLYYEQMCSYHNRNRLSLPEDPQLQMALRRLVHGSPPNPQQGNSQSSTGFEEEFHMMPSDDVVDEGDEVVAGGDLELSNHDSEEGNSAGSRLSQVVAATDMNNRMFSEGSSRGPAADKNARLMNAIQIKRERLKKMKLKMEMKHLKWMRSIAEKDRELQKMRMDNELMNMENEKLEQELKEMEMGIKPHRI